MIVAHHGRLTCGWIALLSAVIPRCCDASIDEGAMVHADLAPGLCARTEGFDGGVVSDRSEQDAATATSEWLSGVDIAETSVDAAKDERLRFWRARCMRKILREKARREW